MRPAPVIALVGLCLTAAASVRAQEPTGLSNLSRDTLPAGDSLRFPAAGAFPATVAAVELASGRELDVAVDAERGVAGLAANESVSGQIAWSYRRLDRSTFAPRFRLDSALLTEAPLTTASAAGGESSTTVAQLRRELGAVDYRGTFGRGLRFGNSQNLALDSRLDLQLTGDLGDGLRVDAVVSDQNIPLQPEGNTVQLQEFDRLFVTVARDPHSLTAGDYSLRADRGRFLRFDKNLQGLAYRYASPDTAGARLDARATAAASRGTFRRIRLPLADGNQGPYRLTGERGEPFVIVLAGTERVYLDGRLLERGIDRDYVIDYNRGELTFTPRLLVNRFQRIVVEYEYSDREYLRTLLTAEGGLSGGDWTLYAQGFQQQDGLRRTGAELSPTAEATLRDAEGESGGVLVPSATPLEPGSANPLRYRAQAIDPTDRCGLAGDSIFVFDPLVDDDRGFAVVFSDVGEGGGDYRLASEATANGAVFEYVPRTGDCQPAGRYAPLRRVQTPLGLRVVTVGGAFAPDSSLAVRWETSGSQRNNNRYAAGAKEAFAGFADVERALPLGAGTITLGAGLEGTTDGYEAVAPWRGTEFKRVWNLGSLAEAATLDPGAETLLNGRLGYRRTGLAADYALEHYRQEDRYSGWRHHWSGTLAAAAASRAGNWTLTHEGDVLAAERAGVPTSRAELSAAAKRATPRWTQTFGVRTLGTRNYDAVTDDTLRVDRRVTEWWAEAARSPTDSTWAPALTYRGRADGRDGGLALVGDRAELSHQIDLAVAAPRRARTGLTAIATYRRTESAPVNSTTDGAEDYYLGRLTHDYRSRRGGWFRTQTTVEAGSGQERRIAVQYVRVQPGLGQYVWRDYDDDGVEDLGEFEVARFADSATYVRAVALTDEYVATNTLSANQNLNVDLARLGTADDAPGLGRFARRLSGLSTASLRRRALQEEGYARLLAVDLPADDTTVVGDDLAWRAAAFLNRARDAFRVELDHGQSSRRSITLQGLEQFRSTEQSLSLLQPLGSSWRALLDAERGRRRSRNEGLPQRDYLVREWRAAPGLRFQPGAYLRTLLEVSYREGDNANGPERVIARAVRFEIDANVPEATFARVNPFAGATLRGEVERVSQGFSGAADSPAGFALLEGLRPGVSWLWSATIDQQLGRALQLGLRYEGRRLGAGRVIHSGQAQVQAVF